MCKFLIPSAPSSQTEKNSVNEGSKMVLSLEKDNKKLEEALFKNLSEKKVQHGASAKMTFKFEDLLVKLKKLDEIAMGLEEKNKANEIIIKKQNKMIAHLKERYDSLKKEKEEKKILEDKVNELKNLLEEKNKENEELREALKGKKSIDLETDPLDLSQSYTSDLSTFRKFSTKPSIHFSNNEKMLGFHKLKSDILNTEISDFEKSIQLERKESFISNVSNVVEAANLSQQINESMKKHPHLFGRKVIYYNQAKMIKLAQNLALGKLF